MVGEHSLEAVKSFCYIGDVCGQPRGIINEITAHIHGKPSEISFQLLQVEVSHSKQEAVSTIVG